MVRGGQVGEPLVDRLRAACARVVGETPWVALDEPGLRRLAADLGDAPEPAPHPAAALGLGPDGTAGAVLVMAALNFGSGWWPTIRRRPGLSGARTMAAGLAEWFAADGVPDPDDLTRITVADVAARLGQDPGHPLMDAYARTLCDLGARVRDDHGGAWTGPARAAGPRAEDVAAHLHAWDAFADTAAWRGTPVPFAKRAQLAAADLHRSGAAPLADLGRLTAFADNLVPHTLGIEGALRVAPALRARIDREELLPAGGEEEVSLRAGAVAAVERLAALTGRPPHLLDALLWERGRRPEVKARPRPRVRCDAY